MFTQDNRTESFLNQVGVKYCFMDDIKISILPDGWDNTNHGRPVSLREDAVIEYGTLMESGSPAPAVIIREDSKGTLTVLDGIQRLAAARISGFTRFSAYVVSTDSEDTAEAIRVIANARLQGHAESSEWTKRNAVQRLMLDRNMSAKDVATMGGWKASDLERLAKVLDWGFQIRCIGGPQKLSDGIVQQIANATTQEELRKGSIHIAEFLNTLLKAQFSSDDAGPYIEDFFLPASKVSAYKNRLKEFIETPEVETRLHGRTSSGMSVGVKLRRYLKSVIGVLDTAIQNGEDLQYVDEFFKLAKQIDQRLRKLAPHCKSGKETQVSGDKWK